MEQSIKDLLVGEEAEVIGYTGTSQAYRSKLLSMGLTKGTVFRLVKVAPLGDPVELEVRGFNLSLRKSEAEALRLAKCNAEKAKEGTR